MKQHWRRDEPQFFNAFALPWETGSGPALTHGVEARLVTRDGENGSGTYMLRIPPGWRHTALADEGSAEIFVLEGDLAAEGRSVGCTGFVAVPQGCGAVELSSAGGCQALLWWNTALAVEHCYDGGELQVRKIWQEPWLSSIMPGLQPGIMHKSLRTPDPHGGLIHGGPSGMLRLILMAPGFGETRQEVHHDCWEEMFWLAGDFMMPQRGLHAAGSVLSNPAELKHGPLITVRGNVQILHCNAPMGADFHFVEGGAETREAAQDGGSWLAEAHHTDWTEMQHLHFGDLATTELEYAPEHLQ